MMIWPLIRWLNKLVVSLSPSPSSFFFLNVDEVISNAASSVTSDDEDDETDDDSVEGGEDGEGSADRLLVF